jgi:hypothetical protein
MNKKEYKKINKTIEKLDKSIDNLNDILEHFDHTLDQINYPYWVFYPCWGTYPVITSTITWTNNTGSQIQTGTVIGY